MPELPEVDTIRRGLADYVLGKTITAIIVDCPKSFHGDKNTVYREKLVQVSRRGKMLILHFTGGHNLAIHLRMTGQLVYVAPAQRFGGGHPTDSLDGPLPDRHTRVTIKFTDHSSLFFNDQRKFGFIQALTDVELPDLPFLRNLGPEPLDPDLTTNQFIARFAGKTKSNIKSALLDQHNIAGVGNIYADESLFLAQIHPATPVALLTHTDFDRLLTAVRTTMTASINSGGSTMATYRRADGSRGDYLEKFANVFHRDGLACPICGTTIMKTRVAGRGTHYCPHCQPVREALK
jgi:formamidopyrimidine-DNA glycosylase